MSSHAGAIDSPVRSARIALFTLTGVNLLNYLDRYLVAGIVAPLESEFGASKSDIGLLTSVFLLVYMLASPLIGLAAARWSRTAILGTGVLVWSLATIGSGFAHSMVQLLMARAIVGLGEAAYSTVGPALLADHYEPRRRPLALSIFYAAIPVGTALSYIVAGIICQSWGWRAVFYAGGVPGIALAIICSRLADPPRGQHDAVIADAGPAPPRRARRRTMLAALARSRDFIMAVAGYAAFTFAFGALAVWLPDYLQTQRGWGVKSSTTLFGIVLVASGFAGTLGGGWLARRLGGGRRTSLLLCAGCMMVAIPATLAALYSEAPWLIIAGLAVASTFSFATQGPVNAVIVNSVDATTRPFALGTSVLAIHLFGDVPSPWLIGAASDAGFGMTLAMSMVPCAMAVALAIWLVGGLRR